MDYLLTKFSLLSAGTFFLSAPVCLSAIAAEYGPLRYLQKSDSPWVFGIERGTIYLEDFEDGLLNTPYVSALNGGLMPGGDIRSVDGDDGVLNGTGGRGGAWDSHQGAGHFGRFGFSFSRNSDGHLPAFVGVVVTFSTGRYFMDALTGPNVFISTFLLDTERNRPDLYFRDTSTAQFIGIHVPEGIQEIWLSGGQIDHLHYGYSVPEPSIGAAAGFFLAWMSGRRRRSAINA